MKHEIPIPITFNPYKHHLFFLLDQIEIWKKQNWENIESELQLLGENLIDFYTGKLTVPGICEECISYFNNKKITNQEAFINWINPMEYRKIRFSDSSVWLIKAGLDPKRFIHIHPAKQSPFTIRVRAITLKTIIALQIQNCSILKNNTENLNTVNQIRKEFLCLSPIKSLHSENGILKLWALFEKINHTM